MAPDGRAQGTTNHIAPALGVIPKAWLSAILSTNGLALDWLAIGIAAQ